MKLLSRRQGGERWRYHLVVYLLIRVRRLVLNMISINSLCIFSEV